MILVRDDVKNIALTMDLFWIGASSGVALYLWNENWPGWFLYFVFSVGWPGYLAYRLLEFLA